jgi:hypothetical protein
MVVGSFVIETQRDCCVNTREEKKTQRERVEGDEAWAIRKESYAA